MTTAARTETPLFPCWVSLRHARFSPCRAWRYTLHRVWDDERGLLMVIGLNPSTADEVQNDPTVTRCVNYARAWGFGGLLMMNAFAYRATFPKDLKAAPDPVGPDNDFWLRRMAEEARLILAAWGNHGLWLDRQAKVLSLIGREVYCLGVTKEGAPRHPLYLRKDAEPWIFREKN
jgi:hypothetical protein